MGTMPPARRRRPQAAHVKLRRLELVLTGLAGVAGVIPGLPILGQESWWPPEQRVFHVVPVVLGAATVALVLLRHREVSRVSLPRVARRGGAGVLLALLLAFAYSAVLDRAVMGYTFEGVPERAVVPFGISSWAGDDLLGAVRLVETIPNPPERPRDVTLEHVRGVGEELGPATLEPLLPAGPRNATVAVLLALYSALIVTLTASFMLLAVRLVGQRVLSAAPSSGDEEERESAPGPQPEEDEEDGDDDGDDGPDADAETDIEAETEEIR